MVSKLAIEFRCNDLCQLRLRTAYNRNGAHGDTDAEQSADDSVNVHILHICFRFCAAKCPVGLLSHAQTEKVGFCNDEIEVLVVDLRYVLCGVCCCYLSSKVLEQRSRYGGDEVDVRRAVQASG